MKTVADYLSEGFRQTFRHPQYIVLDVLARTMRWVLAVLLVLVAFGVTLAQIPASEADAALVATGVPDLQAFVVMGSLLAHADLLAANLAIAVVLAALFWGLIEAVVRGVIVGLGTLDPREEGKPEAVIRSVLRHLASGVTTRLVLGAAAIFIGLVAFGPVLVADRGEWSPSEARWSIIAGIVLIALVAFSLKILDTLARLGALKLLGTSLPEVVLVSALPALISAAVWATTLALVAGLSLRQALDPLAALGILLAAFTLTSAMVLVRYGSIHRIRHDLEIGE